MDDLTPEQRHINMKRIKAKDTKPELLLRRALWSHGYRYRKYVSSLPGKPDIVLTKYKICIFVDSEYFHGKDWDVGQCERVKNGTHPDYWVSKIENNMKRDREQEAELRGKGWKVMRFWRRDVVKNTDECIKEISDVVLELKINKVYDFDDCTK